MRKTILLIFLALLLSLTAVSATEKQVFGNYVFADESITADSKAFIIRMNTMGSAALVQFDHYYLSLNLGECGREGVYRICFESNQYDTKQKRWKGFFRIYSLKPEIKITRTVDKRNPVMGEEFTFTVKLENTGGKRVANVRFEDDFPDGIEYKNLDNVREDDEGVYWMGSLDIGGSEELKYTLKSNTAFERSLRASVEYFDGNELQTVYSPVIALNVKPAIESEGKFEEEKYEVPARGIDFRSGKDEAFIGEELFLVFYLKNNHVEGKSIDADVTFTIPDALEFLRTDRLKVHRNETSSYFTGTGYIEKISGAQYRWSGKVVSDRIIVLRLRGKFAAKASVLADVQYEFEGLSSREKKTFSIEVKNRPLFISTNLLDKEELDSGQEKIIRVWLQNPNTDIDYSNIRVVFNTTLFEEPPYSIKLMAKSTASRILEKRFIVPSSTKDVNTYFNVYADYTTAFGESYRAELERGVRVKAIKDLIITHSFSPATVQSGQEIEVKTSVKNDRTIILPSVHVRDSVPSEFSVIGLNDRFVDINSKSTIAAYTYRIIAPLVAEQTKFDIETFVDYTESGNHYNYSKTGTVTVNPKKLELRVTQKFSSTSLTKGKLFDISYTITNPEDELLRNIVVHFPVDSEFDLIGSRTYSIRKLDPGESVTLNSIAKLLPKLNETRKLNGAVVTYESAMGAVFNTSIKEQSFSKIADGRISTPSIIVNKTANLTAFAGENMPVELVFRNVGNEDADINVSDGGREWSLNVCSGCTSRLSYNINAGQSGKLRLSPAEVTITSFTSPITTQSNGLEIEVKEKEAAQPIFVMPEEAVEEELLVIEKEEIEETELARPQREFPLVPVIVISVLTMALALIILVKRLKKPEEELEGEDEDEGKRKEGKKEKEPEEHSEDKEAEREKKGAKEKESGAEGKKEPAKKNGKEEMDELASELERITTGGKGR